MGMRRFDETWEELCLRSKRIIIVGIARGWIFPELHNKRKKHGTKRNKTIRESNNLLQRPKDREKPSI